MEPGDGLLMMSDGITQAGLGHGLPHGWRDRGGAALRQQLPERTATSPQELPTLIHARRPAGLLGRGGRRLHGRARPNAVAVRRSSTCLTGPPSDGVGRCRGRCGGSCSRKGSRWFAAAPRLRSSPGCSASRITVEKDPQSMVAPPRYDIPGVDLVTEGAVTLNQVYNVLDEDLSRPCSKTAASPNSARSCRWPTASTSWRVGQRTRPAATSVSVNAASSPAITSCR